MTELRGWVRENATLVYFLIAQAIAIGTVGVSVIVYMTKLEQRVALLESRGSSHLEAINNRLTVTEKETQSNKERVDRVVEIMTRELGKSVK